MAGFFAKLFGGFFSPATKPAIQQRACINLKEKPQRIYAIGDVHGRFDLLQKIENKIIKDAKDFDGTKLIVMLGDYVDRGPQSAEVISHLIAPPPTGFERICLAGNHEQVMLDFLHAPESSENWLKFGGDETLRSYGISPDLVTQNGLSSRKFAQILKANVPDDHLKFLSELPSIVTMPDYIFVHAGIRPGVEISQQVDQDLMWIRGKFLTHDWTDGPTIVHGHTPGDAPEIINGRVNIDTGAYATEKLTAARVDGSGVSFLSTP